MNKGPRYDSPFRAAVNGVLDLFGGHRRTGRLEDSDRIDGKSCLVTGANRGLGRAVAVELARRGGQVVMGCRSGHPQAAAEIRKLSGSDRVEMAFLDLADFDTIHSFCDRMKASGTTFDIVVLNAGVVPAGARRTRQGFEEMFGVNYLANFVLVNRLLEDGTIPADPAAPGAAPGRVPRLVFISSETHRSAGPIDFDRLGRFRAYGRRESMKHYGLVKLLLSTYAVQLSRRLRRGGRIFAAVHHLCPGPVNSDIAREAPGWSKPLLKLLFALFFKKPAKAAEPVVYLCCSPALEGRSGVYLHLMTEKRPSPDALKETAGRRLWKLSEELVRTGPRS